MQGRDFKPPEEKTSPITFFVLGLFMVAVTFWTVWDEAFTRRPWKQYQKQFNAYEKNQVEKELARLKKTTGSAVAELDKKIAAQEQKLAGDEELKNLKEELTKSELDAFEKVQELGFRKALFDQSYFYLQEAIRQGHDKEAEQTEVDEAKALLDEITPVAAKAEAARDAIKAKIEAKENELKTLQATRRKVAGDISSQERRLKGIAARPYEISQLVLREYERNNFNEPVMKVERCQTCHLGINRAGFEDAPQPFRTHPNRRLYLSTHEFNKVGCTLCHGGQGTAVTSLNTAHGHVQFWEDPLLHGSETQTKCRSCHTEIFNIPEAPKISRGISLTRELGCNGCHTLPGTEGLRKVGPDLSRIQEKVAPAWLVSWVKKPKDYNPRTRMPYFSFSDQEALDIATYVWRQGPRKVEQAEFPNLDDAALVKKGKSIFEEVGCLGCHIRNDKDLELGPPLEGVNGRPIVYRNRDFAPALQNIGAKIQPDWLFRWLKNPKAYWHDTKMPSLRLTDEEASAVTAYLVSLTPKSKRPKPRKLGDEASFERGKKLVATRGCFGCHVIPGTEKLSKIGPDLTRFAAKKPFELSFGNVVDMPHTWEAWTFGKLKNPQLYQTERETLLMPNFEFSDPEVSSIRTLLRSMTPHGAPHSVHQVLDTRARRIENGRRMVEKYNCNGCHVIENWGGDLLRRYEDKTNGPPLLNGEGRKVQPDWFFGFLRNVVTLRPWLKVRMPSFQMPDEDAAALVDYFAALDSKLNPYIHFDAKSVSAENLQAGKKLFGMAECMACHGEWPPPPGQEPPTAPNLLFSKERLRPDWIVDWLIYPGRIQPGTKMPNFFEGAGSQAQIVKGVRGEKEDDLFIYELEATEEVELPEEQFATLRVGGATHLVKVTEIDEKKVAISSPADLGKTIGKATLESHGEPIDEELLGGDAYRQIRAMRDYLMIETNFLKPGESSAKNEAPQTGKPEKEAEDKQAGNDASPS